MKSWKPRTKSLGRSKAAAEAADALCKRHPKHRQSPGVCSICLCEKLSNLSSPSCKRAAARSPSSSCSSSSYLSSLSDSEYSSSCSSPVVSYAASLKAFKENRPMAFILQRREYVVDDDDDDDDVYGTKKIEIISTKGGFWSKLMMPRKSNKRVMMMHSRTMREGIY